jgi:pimeloyl-ACP methyl ester carboxylesterase
MGLPMNGARAMSTITAKDGTGIYYQDWGQGPVVTVSHGWPLNADAWDGQTLFLVQHVARDRCGHGCSSQPGSGNDMVGYADDLAAVIEALDLYDATLALWGWGNPAIEAIIAVGVLLVAFFAVERRTESPLINVRIFANQPSCCARLFRDHA